jgi:phenylalanyl-tRNA synthetase beta chain
MNASRRWLEAFLRRPLDARDVADRLAMLGAPVDAIEPIGAELAPFVVGLVTEAAPHPNADKLRVTTVDDGSGELHHVVCGAPNVTAGGKYPFARLGTTMPDGMVISRRKLRGEVSEGMLCSARELHLGEDHDGLLELHTDAAPGTPLLEVLPLRDDRLVIDVTPNRGDLLGHKGIARELAAAYGVAFRLPEIPDAVDVDIEPPGTASDEAVAGGIRVAIEDRDGCGRFLGAVIRGVRIGPSPGWLRDRLAAVGVRSINNVVDATNYLMLELNQPMHAYDADTLHGPAIVVRSARAGERLTTLDGIDRAVPTGALLIADQDRAIGLAGVMGGRATEVTPQTTNVFLECAWFDPARVRRTRRSVPLSTEASHRFERGTDRRGAGDAFRRGLRLLLTVAGGTIDGAGVDCSPTPWHPPRIFVRPARVGQVLGAVVSPAEIEKALVAIGATVLRKPDDDRIAIDVPGWRTDLLAEIDLIEEIARVRGYDTFEAALGRFRPGSRQDDALWTTTERLRSALAAEGLSEAMTFPMVAASDGGPRLLNPLSADHAALRSRLLPGLIAQVEANWAQQTADIRLFEIGTVFLDDGAGGSPSERTHAAFVVTGARRVPHWTDAGRTPQWDRWDARGLFERLARLAHSDTSIDVEAGRWVATRSDGTTVGWCGPCPADAPPWAGPVFGGEMVVDVGPVPPDHYRPLPTQPAAIRDLALVVPLARPASVVTALLRERGARHGLESVDVIDEYRGAAIPDGTRGIAVRLVFRVGDRTLTDNEVDQAVTRLRQSLERELDVTLRTT